MKRFGFSFIIFIVSLCLLAFIITGCNSSKYNFRVGISKIDITPTENPLPALMGGATAIPAESVSIPLYVKAMVISGEKQKLAIVTIDNLKYPSTQTDEAAKQIEKETGISADNVIITASHTHSGPLYQYYKDGLLNTIVKAVKEANNSLTVCQLGISNIQVTGISHNRRLLVEGEVWNDWLVKSPTARYIFPAAGPVNPELQVLAAISKDGKYKAILWNYACHANSNSSNTISADYPGYVQQYINEKLGYDAMTLFLTGACGDINPSNTTGVMGETIGDAIIKSFESIDIINTANIYVNHQTLQIPSREDPVFAEEEIAEKWPAMLESYKQSFENTLRGAPASYEANLTGIRIGDDFAIITTPGELFAAIGLDIEKNSPFKYTMVVEQTNGALGYIPTTEDFKLKGYETWYGEHSNLSVNAGEIIKNESLNILKDLQMKK